MRVELAPAAAQEVADAAQAYEATRPGLGEDFVAQLDRGLIRIAEFPEMAALVAPGIRRAVLHQFPFSVVYRVRGNIIEVLALAPHRGHPDRLLGGLASRL